MAESMESLVRRGAISGKQAGKLGALKGTKVQASKMAPFDDKAGKRDQGAGKERGAPHAGNRHIDKNQREGSPIGGKVSKGGGVGLTGQPGPGEIDEGNAQKPDFPAASSMKGSNAKRKVGVKGFGGKSSGPRYGGPNSRADG